MTLSSKKSCISKPVLDLCEYSWCVQYGLANGAKSRSSGMDFFVCSTVWTEDTFTSKGVYLWRNRGKKNYGYRITGLYEREYRKWKENRSDYCWEGSFPSTLYNCFDSSLLNSYGVSKNRWIEQGCVNVTKLLLSSRMYMCVKFGLVYARKIYGEMRDNDDWWVLTEKKDAHNSRYRTRYYTCN